MTTFEVEFARLSTMSKKLLSRKALREAFLMALLLMWLT